MSKMSPSHAIQIAGEAGGGQLLRSALSLSVVTGQRFRITNIRGRRAKPGLMRQHLTAVKAAAEVCGATVTGAEVASTELDFQPGKMRAGSYHFAIGSGGSTTLVLQTLLPALLHAEAPSSLRIEGGTHNPMAPPFEFVERCYLPALHAMGATANVVLERVGFMQAGGGLLSAEIQPIQKWSQLQLLERGELDETFGLIRHAHLPPHIAEREMAEAASVLSWPMSKIELREEPESAGPGNAILLGARFANVCEITTGIAQRGTSAEAVARGAARELSAYLEKTAPVGIHLADQLLLPMALAGGGVFRTSALSNHIRTNMALIEQFLPLRFTVREIDQGVMGISCG